MGTENDIESFIAMQKQKLAEERNSFQQRSDYSQENNVSLSTETTIRTEMCRNKTCMCNRSLPSFITSHTI